MPSMYTSGTSDTSGTGHASRSGFPGYSDAGRNPAPNDFGTGTKVIDPANVDTGLCQVLLTVKLFGVVVRTRARWWPSVGPESRPLLS